MAKIKKVSRLKEDIMTRCYNPKSIMYEKYGGRGIRVCDEWHDLEKFKQWAFANGFDGTQRIERIDNNGDYCPENCRLGTTYTRKLKNDVVPITKSKTKYKGNNRIIVKYHPLYGRYHTIRQRCENPKNKDFKRYGARGITVCDEWKGRGGAERFIKWAVANGYREDLQIDRIDNDKGYSPNNCRWITVEDQQQNRRGITVCKYGGENMSISKIARLERLSYGKIKHMIEMFGVETKRIE